MTVKGEGKAGDPWWGNNVGRKVEVEGDWEKR